MSEEKIDTGLSSVEEQYEELIKKANELYPNIAKDVEVFASYKTELQSYEEYLSLINQIPHTITSNSASVS